MAIVSSLDVQYLAAIRQNVRDFMARSAGRYARPGLLLDIAPQDHEGARPFFPDIVEIETLDIDPSAGCTYTGDICHPNDAIADGRFDFVVCTEVLEHTLHPFNAVKEIHRILGEGGLLLASAPFNFRIHGPLPDCWRFSEYGWRALLSDFEILELSSLEAEGRDLAPIHYTIVARKPV